MEFAKKDLEFNLERASNDNKALSEKLQSTTTDMEDCRNQLQRKDETVKDLESQVSSIRNEVTSLFLSLSQFLDVNCDKEEEMKPSLYSAVHRIFPAVPKSEERLKDDIELVLLSAVDKVSLLKSRFHSLEEDLKVKTSVISSQSKQLNDLLSLSESDKEMISKLRSTVDALQSDKASAATAEMMSDNRVAELEKSNESLRGALKTLKENLQQQQHQVEESETKCISLQQELVRVQQNSNDVIQQMYTANEEKMKGLEEDNSKLSRIAEDATNEVSTLRLLLEQSSKQYEQELTVLREKKSAMEQQVTVSEKFLDSTNRAHREELTKLTLAEQEAQKETQVLRISLVEKESELRACMENFTTLREESHKEIQSLSQQLAALQLEKKQEREEYEREKRMVTETEQHLDDLVRERVQETEQKEREIARQRQREYEEEVRIEMSIEL